MALRVIGAGFGRTGTLSLKNALEKLGFEKCYHMLEVFSHPNHAEMWLAATRGQQIDWDELFEGFAAAVDWPSCSFWREQMAFYPEAKVILSVRSPESWYESVRNTIYHGMTGPTPDDPRAALQRQMARELVLDRTFGGRFEDREHAIRVFQEHNDLVKRTVPAERLLIFEAAQGWAPLCAFLGVPVPAEPYPKVNTTEEFRARFMPK